MAGRGTAASAFPGAAAGVRLAVGSRLFAMFGMPIVSETVGRDASRLGPANVESLAELPDQKDHQNNKPDEAHDNLSMQPLLIDAHF